MGAIHATPVVVNGHVYFGTATQPAVHKLAPDGTLKWTYRIPTASPSGAADLSKNAYSLPKSGFVNSALVTSDAVYIGDLGGIIYSLDRFSGKERWKIDTRSKPFPGAHASNCVFSAPILAGENVVVAGGGYEHGLAADPKSRGCTGRGFVVALERRTGRVVWKYDVGPEPKPLLPQVKIVDTWGMHTFDAGPSTSSVWCTPSFDEASGTIFFGTDGHNSPRQPSTDDPRLDTRHSCALIAVDASNGKERWVTQISPDNVWHYAMPGYDLKTGRYKDQSIGDTPKIYKMETETGPRQVVGAGCKNGGFYVLDAVTGALLQQTPVYSGPPTASPENVDPRTLALPGVIGGLQTGCATDGRSIYTNGIDSILRHTSPLGLNLYAPPSGGRVVSISLDTKTENWRHERPRVKAIGDKAGKPLFTDVGDPVGSGIALANGVTYFTTTVSNRLVALDTRSGKVLKEIELGPVWCGPSVSRGRVYVGTGNILFLPPEDAREAYFPKRTLGALVSFGLPGEDEVDGLGEGNE